MRNELSHQVLSDLIGSIYDCALDPSRWENTLSDVKDVLCSQTAVLALTDISQGRILISKSVGIATCWLREIPKHAAEINNFTHGVRARASSLDDPQLLSRDYSRSQFDSSPYVQECLKPQGLVDVLQYILIDSPTRVAAIGLGRHERQGIVTEREIEIGKLLLPHIRRSVIISDVLDVRTVERARMAEALDALRCGVLLTDARGAILHANIAAEHMLREGGPIQDSGGVLRARDPAAGAELRDAIAVAARDEASIGKTGTAIRLTEQADIPPMFAHVLPLTGGDLRTRLQPAAVAAIFIGARPDEREVAEIAAATYGLTSAETRVLASLFSGRTVAETATDLGIATNTVKTHLDRIFAKTGVSRQADLMRLVTGLVPPSRSNG
jgi:DNA-binding CsgD family transcriptional regulator